MTKPSKIINIEFDVKRLTDFINSLTNKSKKEK